MPMLDSATDPAMDPAVQSIWNELVFNQPRLLNLVSYHATMHFGQMQMIQQHLG